MKERETVAAQMQLDMAKIGELLLAERHWLLIFEYPLRRSAGQLITELSRRLGEPLAEGCIVTAAHEITFVVRSDTNQNRTVHYPAMVFAWIDKTAIARAELAALLHKASPGEWLADGKDIACLFSSAGGVTVEDVSCFLGACADESLTVTSVDESCN